MAGESSLVPKGLAAMARRPPVAHPPQRGGKCELILAAARRAERVGRGAPPVPDNLPNPTP